MRKQIDGLVQLVEMQYRQKLDETSIFLFCGHRADRINALYWDGYGRFIHCTEESLRTGKTGDSLLTKNIRNTKFQKESGPL